MDYNKKVNSYENLKVPSIIYVITDFELNIKEYDEKIYDFIGNEKDVLDKKINIYFPKLNNNFFNSFYKIKNNENVECYIKQTKITICDENYYLFFIADFLMITEIEKQVNYLNHEKYIYNEMLNKLEDGIYITDEIGETLYVNDAFVNLSGLSRNSLIGKKVQKLKGSNVLPNSCCEKVIQTHKTVTTINNYYKGQKCLVTGSLINDEKGTFKRTIAVVRDVSELDMLMKKVAKEEKNSFYDKNVYVKKIKFTKSEINDKNAFIASNNKVKDIYSKALKFADIDTTVLILGETGVGKDYLASYIHNKSKKREGKNIIKINCSAIPEHLIESELFGYEDGAFTGAKVGGKKGLFEEAGKGTIFLDEIGEMPYTLQVKLLNVLNDKYFYRIGATKKVPLDARIIAATNANIEKLIAEKKFRADLYYRLNVINLTVPPLRERKEDIIPLSQYFLEYYNNQYRKNCFFSSDCLKDFLIYNWPGNIREMKNLVERLILIEDDVCIESKLFREQVGDFSDFDSDANISKELSLKEQMGIYERTLIKNVMEKEDTLKKAAEILKIDISTLVRKKQKYSL
jgi:PAS domain S-box-containing protein